MDNLGNLIKSSEKLEPAVRINETNSTVVPGAHMQYGLRLYSMADLMSQEFPDELWIVNGLIPEGVTVLSAAPASFKTWLLLSLAVSVAQGSPMFNHFATEQTAVLMIDEENSGRLLQQRLRMLGAAENIPIHFMVEQDFKLTEKAISKVIQFCEENNVGLITFDSLVRIHRGNENDAGAMAEVFAMIRRFSKVGINVIVTHHNRKGSKSDNVAQDMRGSTDILAAVDCHIAISRDEAKRLVLTQTKLRHSEEHEPVEVEIVSTEDKLTLRYVGTLQPTESKKVQTMTNVQELLKVHGKLNQTEIALKLEEVGAKVNAKSLRKVVNDMVQRKLLVSTRGKGSELLYEIGLTEQKE